jgi:hypothetical protein
MYLLFAYPNLYNCQTSLKHTLDVKGKRPVFELKEIQNKYYSSAKVLHNGNHRRLIGFGLNEINCCQALLRTISSKQLSFVDQSCLSKLKICSNSAATRFRGREQHH